MSEQAGVQALLNVQEPPRPEITPSKENNGPVEHALSLTGALSQADSTALPIPESDHLSKGFLDLDTKEGEEHFVASAKAQSRYWVPSDPAESAASPRAHTPPASPASEINYEASDKENHTVAKAAAPATPTKGAASSPAPAPAPSPVRLEGTSDARRKDAEAAAVAARERDVAAAFAGLPSVRPNWQHRYLKMIIVGDDGVGKTTFVRNLFAAYASDVDFPVADASGAGAAKVFGDAPERLCTELVLKDEEQQVWWHYLVQDTPGYGDFDGPEDAESQRTAVLEHIRACSERYYQQETSPDRGSPLHTVPDIRIDVCLYFLQPHRLRRTDIRFIKELSKLVPVVPVLAKADAMTPEELHQFREAVREKLHRHRHADKWQFSQEALEGAGAGRGPPFAVVAASTVDRSVGRFWPVRRYPWGRAEPLSTAHSELPTLRKLLFETGYWELKAHTDEEYLGFRKKRVAEDASPVPRPLRPLFRLFGGVAAVVVVTFIAVNAGPIIRDEVVRKETARRVKEKVGEVVESAVGTVQEIQGRTEEARGIVRSTAEAAVDAGKKAAREAAAKLEVPEVRRAREEAERKAARPWWAFWSRR